MRRSFKTLEAARAYADKKRGQGYLAFVRNDYVVSIYPDPKENKLHGVKY